MPGASPVTAWSSGSSETASLRVARASRFWFSPTTVVMLIGCTSTAPAAAPGGSGVTTPATFFVAVFGVAVLGELLGGIWPESRRLCAFLAFDTITVTRVRRFPASTLRRESRRGAQFGMERLA